MKAGSTLLEKIFGRILTPFEQFLRRTTAGGLILLATTVMTLILANSPWGEPLSHIWEKRSIIGFGNWHLELTLHQFVNDGLMTLFFLLVGLELKREILVGELSSFREATMPVVAAVGGMIIPAGIYLAINGDGPAASGWGIPMATDIAFSIGILVLLGWRIPPNLIIFLTALAIVDDLGAGLAIAIYYTQEISPEALGSAAGVLAVLFVLNRGGIRHPLPYGILGFFLWLSVLKSGIHPTMAGILLAFSIPARPVFTAMEFEERVKELQRRLHTNAVLNPSCEDPLSCPPMATVAQNLEKCAKTVQAPLQRMEHSLNPWVTFLIIPIFALSNAGIQFTDLRLADSLMQPLTLGVTLGLVLGKFTGISAFSWLAVKFRISKLPSGVRWRHVLGVAWLGGIGFTMSLFISQLAFQGSAFVEQSKLGILLASALSAVIGLAWLFFAGRDADRHR